MEIEPTDEEQRAIKSLKLIAKKWPKTLWLFSASGSLCVMRYGPDGERVHDNGGYIDKNYILDDIDIPNDGGDW